ncbi:MAG: transposase, partial [Thermoprotei archaeon]
MVKYDFYLEVMKRCEKPLGNNITGVDVNVDRLNLVVINGEGDIVWKYTVRFPQVTARGYPRKRAWSIIGEAVHSILRNAYSHGASVIAVENPKVIGYLRYYWIRNGERRSK